MKNKKKRNIIYAIIIIGCILRLIYIIKMPYDRYQHDLDDKGLDYICTIYKTGELPKDNEGQHYHPPLHYLISGYWLKIISCFTTDENILFESLQYVTLIYSILIIVVMYKILKELKVNEKFQLLIMTIFSLFPNLIILSGSLNSDELGLLLIMLTMLYLIKWFRRDNIKNTLLLSIATGMSVMAKTSGAMIAIPIMYIFLLKVYKEFKKNDNKTKIIKKYGYLFTIFGVFSLTIGLWYPIRNYILFNQPILYVLEPKNSNLYIGNYSILERFIPLSSIEFIMPYCNPWLNYNLPIYLIKCSIFGEYIWKYGGIFDVLYRVAIIINIFLIVYIIYAVVRNIFYKNKRNIVYKNINIILFITNLICYISMNLRLPYGCSMDFRYLFPAMFSGIILIYFLFENKYKTNKQMRTIKFEYRLIFALFLIMMICADILILAKIFE